jgi:hypothetical protein
MTNQLKRLCSLISIIFFGIISYTLLTGELQEHIHFTGVLNEIGFFIMTSLLTIISAIYTCVD